VRRPKAELVAPEARLAAWLGDRLVVVEGEELRIVGGSLRLSRSGITALAASPDGRWLGVGTRDGTIALYDEGGALRFEGVVHNGPVSALAFDLAGNRVYAAGADGEQGLILGLRLP
jgi:WD40 repeat protein